MISASQFQPDIIDWVRIYSCIDHTSLEGTDDDRRISDFTRKVKDLGETLPGKNHVAAVCTYPVFVSLVADILNGTQINTASVRDFLQACALLAS